MHVWHKTAGNGGLLIGGGGERNARWWGVNGGIWGGVREMSRPYRALGRLRQGGMGPRAAPWALLFRPFGAGEGRQPGLRG